MSYSAPKYSAVAEHRRTSMVVAAVALVGTALLASRFRHYTMDDAYIGYRYIDNLLGGEGFVFNPGERVEGVTNAGWLLLLTPVAALVGPELAAKLVGAALLALASGLAAAVVWRVGPAEARAWLAPLAAALVLTRFDVTYFSLAGMETALLAVLLLLAVWLTIDERRPWTVAAIGAAAFTVHPEAVLVFPLAVVLIAAGRGSLRDTAARLFFFAALVGAITVVRYLYFGELLPNTASAKATGHGEGMLSILYPALAAPINVPFPFGGLFVLAIVAAGAASIYARAPRAAAMAGAAVATGYLFARYAPDDWTRTGRYFAPYAPVGCVLLLMGGAWIERRLVAARRPYVTVALAGLIALTGALDTLAQSSAVRLRVFPGYVLAARPLVEPSRWLAGNLPEGATIASRRIGALAYFGKRRVFDYVNGLTDREVARRVRQSGGRFWSPAHEDLADLWRAQRPDYLLEDSDVMEKIVAETGGTPELFRIHGLAYRVMRRFPVGARRVDGLFGREERPVDWTLAQRLDIE